MSSLPRVTVPARPSTTVQAGHRTTKAGGFDGRPSFWRLMSSLLRPLLSAVWLSGTVFAARIDVTSHGAVPDDARDDTAAIQEAIDSAQPGDTVFFPRGTHRVVTVNIRPGLHYEGEEGAVLLRHGRQPDWTRTFTTEGYRHEDNVDSVPTIFTGLTFDGGRAAQGRYRDYESFGIGAATGFVNRIVMPGRVRFTGCTFRIQRKGDGDPFDYHGLDVFWDIGPDRPRGQLLEFRQCRFECAPGFKAGERRHAIVSRNAAAPDAGRLLISRDCVFGEGFTSAVFVEDGGIEIIQQ